MLFRGQMMEKLKSHCTDGVPARTPPPPSHEQLIERSDTLLCYSGFGLFFCFGPQSLFSFYGCQRTPLAPSYGMSFCCLSDPTGRISPGPGTQREHRGHKQITKLTGRRPSSADTRSMSGLFPGGNWSCITLTQYDCLTPELHFRSHDPFTDKQRMLIRGSLVVMWGSQDYWTPPLSHPKT